MKSIEGHWEGTGHEISLIRDEIIEKTPLKLFFEIKRIEGNNYLGKTQYYLIDGPLVTEETFLILKNGDEFICEDPTGSGINFYNFEQGFHLFGLNKLTYKYNINNNGTSEKLNGEFVLHRRCHC